MTSGIVLNEALVAFGANVGDCEQAHQASLQLLQQAPGIEELRAATAVRTEAVTGDSGDSGESQADYLNSAFLLRTSLDPAELHRLLIGIEEKLGRERLERWGPRSVDLDLILYGDTVVSDTTLQIPHPRMSFRRFVLQPSLEVAGEMVDPRSGMTVSQLLQHLDSKPNQVLLATNQATAAQELIKEAGYDDYEFVIATDEQTFIANASQAKLLVSWINPDEESPLHRYARHFAGPLLNVDSKPPAEALREVIAAVEAMRPPRNRG